MPARRHGVLAFVLLLGLGAGCTQELPPSPGGDAAVAADSGPSQNDAASGDGPLPADAAPLDAGPDASPVDAGADGGPDAGPADAGWIVDAS
jgi:hypothetical protein